VRNRDLTKFESISRLSAKNNTIWTQKDDIMDWGGGGVGEEIIIIIIFKICTLIILLG
jgi:hypothetical protein